MLKVRFEGAIIEQVRWGHNDDPREFLSKGSVYEVNKKDVHSFHTKIELVGFPGKWVNDASFTYLNDLDRITDL